MSWSLRLHNGDLALSGSSLATVTNEEKLVQDLRCALLEKMGTDSLHPTYGSTIDGGTLPDGNEAPGVIGLSPQAAAMTVQSEIQRVVQTYQAQQLARAKNDRLTYNRVSLTPNEVLLSVPSITIEQKQNALNITVTLQTASGQNVAVALSVTP